MLFRCWVVWLFLLTTLLSSHTLAGQFVATKKQASLDNHRDTVSLLPSSEPSLNSLRPHSDPYELQPPQPWTLAAPRYVVECYNHQSLDEALGSLCRGMPIGQAPPSVR
ncbi:MAG: hypothetical protein ACRCXH_04080 [Shewanella sp.]